MFIVKRPKAKTKPNIGTVTIKLNKEQKTIYPRKQETEIQKVTPEEKTSCKHMFEIY
jgi:hypothetical protein